MRFKIRLTRISRDRHLPINYQYELSSAIYRVIDCADSGFSAFLHDHGYTAFDRPFRLFTFSRLGFQGYKVIRETGRIEHYGLEAWFETSFLVDRAAEEFIRGLFMSQEIRVGDKITQVAYQVTHIEAVQPPLFKETMSYRCLSPIFIRSRRADGGEDYLAPGDSGYEKILLENLYSKASAFVLSGQEYQEFLTERFPLELTPIGKVYKNGVRIKQHTSNASQLIGYMYEFTLTAPVELQEVGYYAGFGHLGSQGFGCVGVRNFYT